MKSKKLKAIVLFETPPFKAQNDRNAKRGGHNPFAPQLRLYIEEKYFVPSTKLTNFLLLRQKLVYSVVKRVFSIIAAKPTLTVLQLVDTDVELVASLRPRRP